MKTKLFGLVALVGSLMAVAGTASARECEGNVSRFEMQRHERVREREVGRERAELARGRLSRFRREYRRAAFVPPYRTW